MLAAGSELIGDSEAFNGVMDRMGTPEEIVYSIGFSGFGCASSYMDRNRAGDRRRQAVRPVAVGGRRLSCAGVIG